MNTRPPLHWLVWHPHQGFANGRVMSLLGRVRPRSVRRPLSRVWIHADTAVLTVRAVVRRVRTVGVRHVRTGIRVPDGVDVVHLDLGTHEQGIELAWVAAELGPALGNRLRCYGFEASAETYAQVSDRLGDHPSIRLVHAALCRDVPADGTTTLYKHDDTLSDSIHRRSGEREVVPAMRLSEFLRDHEPELASAIVLLRMNIEGAEVDVMDDLIEHGLHELIDGYFGMWDDMSKIDVERDRYFRRRLRQHRISHCTFNGRDMDWPSRRRFIRYELGTALLRGAR